MPGTPWGDIAANQMLTLADAKLAVEDKIVDGDNNLAPDLPENGLISAESWELFIKNGFTQTLSTNQIVWKDAVKV